MDWAARPTLHRAIGWERDGVRVPVQSIPRTPQERLKIGPSPPVRSVTCGSLKKRHRDAAMRLRDFAFTLGSSETYSGRTCVGPSSSRAIPSLSRSSPTWWASISIRPRRRCRACGIARRGGHAGKPKPDGGIPPHPRRSRSSPAAPVRWASWFLRLPPDVLPISPVGATVRTTRFAARRPQDTC
jgi:hypothetical protein